MELKCQRCNFEWNYEGKKKLSKEYSQFVACPRCRTSVKLEENKKGEKSSKMHQPVKK